MNISKTVQKQKELMQDMHFKRFLELDSTIKKDTPLELARFVKRSFNDALYEGFSPQTELFGIEMTLDEAREKKYFDVENSLSYFDLLPISSVLLNNEKYFSEINEKIFRKKLMPYVHEIQKNIHVHSEGIKKILHARDVLFEAIDEKSKEQVIDITNIGYLSYLGTNAVLAYSKTINDPSYTLVKGNDDMFHSALNKGIFKADIPNAAIFLYSGVGYLEDSWAQKLGVCETHNSVIQSDFWADSVPEDQRNQLLLDMSGIDVYYLFSKGYAAHSTENVNADNLYDFAMKHHKKDRSNILIKNNALYGQNIDEVLDEMQVLRLLSKNFKIFYTFPTTENTTGASFYGSQSNPFSNNFRKEFLLDFEDRLKSECVAVKTDVGIKLEDGYVVKNDFTLHNQYMDKSINLKAGQRIIFHESWRYNSYMQDLMCELSGLSISEESSLGVKYLHN